MDRLGFIDFNTRLSMENSRKAAIKREQTKACFQYAERKQARPEVKASSYAQAIRILDAVLVHEGIKMRKMQLKRDFGSRLLIFPARMWKEFCIFAAT